MHWTQRCTFTVQHFAEAGDFRTLSLRYIMLRSVCAFFPYGQHMHDAHLSGCFPFAPAADCYSLMGLLTTASCPLS